MKKYRKKKIVVPAELSPVEKVEFVEREAWAYRMASPKLRCAVALILSMVMLFSGTIAYFSDYGFTEVNGTAGSLRIEIDDSGVNLLNEDGMDILNPGDMRNLVFSVKNLGNKSADIKTQVKLTSSVPMENGEYELYWSNNVINHSTGSGWTVKEGASPLYGRKISDDKTQITYSFEEEIFSGNHELDEYEAEYEKGPYIVTGEEIVITEKVLSLPTNHGKYEDNYFYFADIYVDASSSMTSLIIPNEYNGKRIDKYMQVFIHTNTEGTIGLPSTVTDIYVPGSDSVYLKDAEGNETWLSEERCAEYGITIHTYEDFYDVASLPTTAITDDKYKTLSETEKAAYVYSPDTSTYDIALLFDRNSGNKFQGSTITIEIEVWAKQHRNTDDSVWELIDSSTFMSVQGAIFTVDYNNDQELELTGIRPDVDFHTLTEITIPEGVEVIPDNFFYDCTNLQSVILPKSLKRIGDYAFYGCSSLTNINLPDSLEYIGAYAFEGTAI